MHITWEWSELKLGHSPILLCPLKHWHIISMHVHLPCVLNCWPKIDATPQSKLSMPSLLQSLTNYHIPSTFGTSKLLLMVGDSMHQHSGLTWQSQNVNVSHPLCKSGEVNLWLHPPLTCFLLPSPPPRIYYIPTIWLIIHFNVHRPFTTVHAIITSLQLIFY
jgi:hypothetical protein